MERKNLWAPWRIKYIQKLSKEKGCFICNYIATPEKDQENLVLWRTKNNVVLFNKFPYNNGHLLIAPLEHISDLDQATDEQLLEYMKLVRDAKKALSAAIRPHGFNVGINIGRPAGAGLPGHMHIHIVPRWDGDTGFLSVCSDVEVISQGMRELYDQLKEISSQQNLPNL